MIIKYKWIQSHLLQEIDGNKGYFDILEIIDYHADPEYFIELKYTSDNTKDRFAQDGYMKRNLVGYRSHFFLDTDVLFDERRLSLIDNRDGVYGKVEELKEGVIEFQKKLRNDKLKSLGIK